jgi:hypothetical protein
MQVDQEVENVRMATKTPATPYKVTPARVSAALKREGWFCHHQVQENGIPITCSIGLVSQGAPCDFIVLGVEENLARMIISGLARMLADADDAPSDGARVPGVLDGFNIELRDLDAQAVRRLNGVIIERTGASISKAQLIQVPDSRGYLPSDVLCQDVFKKTQSTTKIGGAV